MLALEPEVRTELVRGVLARLEAERRGLIPPDFGFWMQWRVPRVRGEPVVWTARHFVEMQNVLNRVTTREWTRVVFEVPIRHGKSQHNTIGHAGYEIERDPSHMELLFSHKEPVARGFSKETRRLVESLGIPLSADQNAAGDWRTTEGGGVLAMGAGAGTASLNADLMRVDDPFGKREQAESRAERDRLWDWFSADVLGRAENTTPVVLTMSRWHEDDIVGRIRAGMAGDVYDAVTGDLIVQGGGESSGVGWRILHLPGRANEDDPLGRELDEPLWPELRDEEFLRQKYMELGPYGFASQIQNEPRPREGGMFKWDWWGELEAIPAKGTMVRYWDTAGTEVTDTNDPDYTAGTLMCRAPDGRWPIVNVERFRHGLAQRNARMFEIAQRDREQFGGRCSWWIETETGIGGRERMTELLRLLQSSGLSVKADPRGRMRDKTLRAEPLAAAAEAGNVPLCPGEWRNTFRQEAADFPGGRHDDQIDAAAGAFAKLAVKNQITFGSYRY